MGAGNTMRICWQVFCSADSGSMNPEALDGKRSVRFSRTVTGGHAITPRCQQGLLAQPGEKWDLLHAEQPGRHFLHVFCDLLSFDVGFGNVIHHHLISFVFICTAHRLGIAHDPFKLEATGSGDGPSSRAFGFQDSSFLVRSFLAQSLSEMAMQMDAKSGSRHGKVYDSLQTPCQIFQDDQDGS